MSVMNVVFCFLVRVLCVVKGHTKLMHIVLGKG